MAIIIHNTFWMAWNLILAAVSVVLGWHLTRKQKSGLRFLFSFLWLIFVPNTIYIITDLYHLAEQWNGVYDLEKGALLAQYFVFVGAGIAAFAASLYFFEYALVRYLPGKFSEAANVYIIAVLNFVIGFGVVVGRVQRTNSWEVFTNPARVYYDITQTLASPTLLALVFVFGALGNIIYFSLRDIYKKPFRSFKKYLAFLHV